MTDIMLDLETMGSGSNSAIIAIGAVKFGSKGLGEEFYQVVDLQSCVNAGLVMDPGTVLWWMKQSEAARKEFERKGVKLFEALSAFNEFLGNESESKIRLWGNGADFDNVILANAYRALREPTPWSFWNNRCYRTMKNVFSGVPYTKPAVAHNALEDAKAQALHLVQIMSFIKGK